MSYIAPVKDMLFCMKELADLEAIARLPGFEDAGLDTAQAVLEECARFSGEVLAPLNREGDIHPSSWKDGVVTTTAGLQGRLPPVRRRRLAGPAAPGRFRRPGPAEDDRRRLHRDDQQRQPELRALPAADRRRDRGAAHRRHARAAGALHPEDDLRRVDRDDEPDRAAGRLRSRPRAHARRAARRRPLQALRHEDLHHLRRARHGREHRPSRAGARRRRARRRQGHQPVHRAEVPGRRATARSARGTTPGASASSTSSASRRARRRCCSSATRRQARRPGAIGTADRPGEPRPRVHVHHDERGALRGRHAGHRRRRARLPEGGRVRQGARAVAAGRRLGRRQRDDHPSPRRAPHADDDARLHRRLPRAGDRRRRGVRRRAPRRRRRGAQAEPGLLRVHGAARQGLQHRDEHRGREPGRAGARRHGLHRGDRRRAIPARCPHPDDLRRHDGDPGQRPGRPQDGARRRPRRQGASPRRSRRPKAISPPRPAMPRARC